MVVYFERFYSTLLLSFLLLEIYRNRSALRGCLFACSMEDITLNFAGYALVVPAYVKQMLLAGTLGALIGVERELRQKVASIRTFTVISLGSCIFGSLSLAAAGGSVDGMPYDVTRVAAGIVTGIGFLGGGVIFKTKDKIEGITTGAMIWLVAALGMSCGFNQLSFAIWSFAIVLLFMLVAKPLYLLTDWLRNDV